MKRRNKEEESPEQRELKLRRAQASVIRYSREHKPWHKLSEEDRQKAMDLLDKAENANNNGDRAGSRVFYFAATKLLGEDVFWEITHQPGMKKPIVPLSPKLFLVYVRLKLMILRIRLFLR
jgi:hypothetical protein